LRNSAFDFSAFKAEIEKLKKENSNLKTKEKNFSEQLEIRKKELEISIANTKERLKKENKLGNKLEFLLEKSLKIQVEIIEKGIDSLAEEEFENLISILEEKVGKKEIENICQKKKIITYLEEIIQFDQMEEAKAEIMTLKK